MSELFRKKSIDRVSSPEQLNDYIRVTAPPVWAVLLALLILLAGMLVWSITGTVTSNEADGSVKEIHPIEFIIN